MGRVKLNFAPLLYVHGTSDRVVIGDPASHGCVRLLNSDLIELTRLIQSYATPDIDDAVLDRLAANPDETTQFNFQRSIPFEVVYNVAAIHNGFLYVYPDVYRKVRPSEYKAQVRDLLEENGIDYGDVNQERLNELLEHGRDNRVSMSLDTLRAMAASPTATAARTR
jgi:murein L,D-transpeptidase YcbB/YkuD